MDAWPWCMDGWRSAGKRDSDRGSKSAAITKTGDPEAFALPRMDEIFAVQLGYTIRHYFDVLFMFTSIN